MSPALISIAAELGLPLIERVLSGRIGDSKSRLAIDTIAAIAREMGVETSVVTRMAEGDADQRAEVEAAMTAVEAAMPDLITLYQAEMNTKMAIFEQEAEGPWWTWAWRPFGMWVFIFLWIYNAALLHWANAIWKIALPPMDWWTLIQLSALYLSLYMGGHTVKSVMASWAGGRRAG